MTSQTVSSHIFQKQTFKKQKKNPCPPPNQIVAALCYYLHIRKCLLLEWFVLEYCRTVSTTHKQRDYRRQDLPSYSHNLFVVLIKQIPSVHTKKLKRKTNFHLRVHSKFEVNPNMVLLDSEESLNHHPPLF